MKELSVLLIGKLHEEGLPILEAHKKLLKQIVDEPESSFRDFSVYYLGFDKTQSEEGLKELEEMYRNNRKTLMNLPNDVTLKVFDWLDDKSKFSFAQTNRHMYGVFRSAGHPYLRDLKVEKLTIQIFFCGYHISFEENGAVEKGIMYQESGTGTEMRYKETQKVDIPDVTPLRLIMGLLKRIFVPGVNKFDHFTIQFRTSRRHNTELEWNRRCFYAAFKDLLEQRQVKLHLEAFTFYGTFDSELPAIFPFVEKVDALKINGSTQPSTVQFPYFCSTVYQNVTQLIILNIEFDIITARNEIAKRMWFVARVDQFCLSDVDFMLERLINTPDAIEYSLRYSHFDPKTIFAHLSKEYPDDDDIVERKQFSLTETTRIVLFEETHCIEVAVTNERFSCTRRNYDED